MHHDHHHHHPTAETIRANAPGRVPVDRGFSLMELVLVVAILGLLASIVVVAVGGFRADAADSRCGADRRSAGDRLALVRGHRKTGGAEPGGGG